MNTDDRADLILAFIEEARDHVDDLNDAFLAIEAGVVDAESTVASAFRAAHSLKGMAATLGFSAMTRITHGLESVLDIARDKATRSVAISSDLQLAALLLEASDRLGFLVRKISADGVEPYDATSESEALCLQLERMATQLADHDAVSALSSEAAVGVDQTLLEAANDSGWKVWQVSIEVDDTALIPAARSYAALMALSECGELLASVPPRSSLEAGTHSGESVVAYLATDQSVDEQTVREAVALREIRSAQVAKWRGAPSVVEREGTAESASAISSVRKTVRVESKRLDDLMHSVGELLVRRSKLQMLVSATGDQDLLDAVESLDRAARELQELVMDVRMVSIDQVLRHIPRSVRDLANLLEKEVQLTITGRDTELDRTVVDVIGDPLIHLIRNAIDHGIEAPDAREAAGKPRMGLIAISATTEGGSIAIRVRDDGAGMKPDLVRATAIRRGVISAAQAASQSDEQALNLCFAPGFSTRTSATEISGRGVGLDVVRSSVGSLGGEVTAESSDEGTVMTIRLPLTLAIRSTLQVSVDGETYAFHTDRVGQAVDLDAVQIHSVAGRSAIVHLGRIIPLIDLASQLHGGTSKVSERCKAVIIEEAIGDPIAVVVDDVLGQSEVVTRPLPSGVHVSDLLGASAVLGDGSIAFVVDTMKLMALGMRAQWVTTGLVDSAYGGKSISQKDDEMDQRAAA